MPAKRDPKERLVLLLTRECSLGCKGCIFDGVRLDSPWDEKGAEGRASLDFEALKKNIVDRLPDGPSAAGGPGKEVVLAGGEPTEHKDFFRILDAFASKAVGSIRVITSGKPFTRSSGEADRFAGKVAEIASRTGARIVFSMSDDDHHAEAFGGRRELDRRLGLFHDAFGRHGLEHELNKCRWVYGDARRRVGTVPCIYIAWNGDVFRSQSQLFDGSAPIANVRHHSLTEIEAAHSGGRGSTPRRR